MTVLFVGGGTMGPVTPLLAVLRRMRERRPELLFAWAGTPDGPERAVVEREGVKFFPVAVAKVPRYVSGEWLTFPLRWIAARRDAEKVIMETKPSLVVSAGGFTAVPVMRVAAGKGIACAIHQLDAEPGLSNRVVARLCRSVTTSFAYGVQPFPGVKIAQVPTPSRFSSAQLGSREEAARLLGLDPNRRTIFIFGGGTGAQALNEAVWSNLDEWLRVAQVVHQCGYGKGDGHASHLEKGYLVQEFFSEPEMRTCYAAADLVISRAGIGSISELASLSRPTIFVPIPGTHQEENVSRLRATTVQQSADFSKRLITTARRLVSDQAMRDNMAHALHDAFPTDDGTALATRWLALLP